MSNVQVLIVEDDAIIALDIKTILEKNNFQCILNIDSVESAIESIENNNFNLVIIDINLNKSKSGIDLGHYLLEKDSIPYIYLTSYSDKTTLDEVNNTRPYGYIVKPFKKEDLISTATIVLNNFRHKNIDTNRINKPKTDNNFIPYKLRVVINYINVNIEKKIVVDELADMTPWTKTHFSRIFKKYLNINPYQYILDRKIEKAKTLMQQDQIRLEDIAFELGFSSYSNFYHAFKKKCKISPEIFFNNNSSKIIK